MRGRAALGPSGRTEWITRLVRRPPARVGTVVAIWAVFSVVYYVGVRLGAALEPLVLIPVIATTFNRSNRLIIWVATFGSAVLLAASAAAGNATPTISVIIGTVTVAFVAWVVHVATQLVLELVEQSDTARAAEAQENQIRETYRTLMNELPVGMWRTTPSGRILDVNKHMAEMFGYTEEEMRAMSAADLYFDPSRRPSAVQVVLDAGVVRGRKLSMKRADGSQVFLRANTQLVADADGNPLYFEGVGVDITQEVRSTQRAEISDTRFRMAFDAAPVGMAIASGDLTIVRANSALEQFLGYGPGELDGVNAAAITVPSDFEVNVALRNEAKERGDFVYSMEKRYIRRDGTIAVALLTAAGIRTETGEDLTVSFVLDLADQIRAEEAWENLVRSKDEFLATVSHELRTPLTVVHGMAHELRDGWGEFEQDEGRELASLIADQSSELVFLVEDLLVAARAETGTLEVNPELVDLAAEINSAVASVPQAAAEAVRLDISGMFATADRLRVRQILRNLITNAHRYGGDEVVVRTQDLPELGLVSVQVRDNGPGVPDDLATSIFEPYERAHTLGTATEAVGLGLTVSRTLAESMGGNLVYRREPDWSVFELSLRPGVEIKGREAV